MRGSISSHVKWCSSYKKDDNSNYVAGAGEIIPLAGKIGMLLAPEWNAAPPASMLAEFEHKLLERQVNLPIDVSSSIRDD